jgi:AcrR family transcriptional regulator
MTSSTRLPARQRLLDAADRLFYAEGVHTVGIDRLIMEAGVAKRSLFYNFSGKSELVAVYLAGRDQRRRERIARHQEGLDDPIEKLLAVFDALHEAVVEPGYNGCPFANANAEALPGSVEAEALRAFRGWLANMFLSLTREAGFADPSGVANRLCLLYDGAVANSHLDAHPDAVRLAKELASTVLDASPRGHTISPSQPSAK